MDNMFTVVQMKSSLKSKPDDVIVVNVLVQRKQNWLHRCKGWMRSLLAITVTLNTACGCPWGHDSGNWQLGSFVIKLWLPCFIHLRESTHYPPASWHGSCNNNMGSKWQVTKLGRKYVLSFIVELNCCGSCK